MKLHKVANLALPAFTLNVEGDNDCDWTPYPRLNQINYTTKPAHLPQVRQGLRELAVILVDFQELSHNVELCGNFQALLAKARGPYDRLQQWLADWPSASQVGAELAPQLLILR